MGGIILDRPATTVLFEHQFWLQIMGDHARFIFYTLAPTETEHIQTAQQYINTFDQLLNMARIDLSGFDENDLSRQAYDNTYAFRKFKLHLLTLTLQTKLKISLSSTFFNHMLNELDEYLSTMNNLCDGKVPIFSSLHYNTLWLSDAIGHAAGIMAFLDEIEADFLEQANEYKNKFTDLYMKAVNLNGYTKTNLSSFPALDRLNQQANMTMVRFKEFLETILQLRLNGTLLGTLMPLMADHMAREECYYLFKLSQTAENVPKPPCDPTKPRVQA